MNLTKSTACSYPPSTLAQVSAPLGGSWNLKLKWNGGRSLVWFELSWEKIEKFGNFLFLAARLLASSQSQNVLDPIVPGPLQMTSYIFLLHVCASHVDHGLEPNQVCGCCRNVDGQVGGRASCAPGDVDKERREVCHTLETIVEILDSDIGLRREEFEGIKIATLRSAEINFVNDFHFPVLSIWILLLLLSKKQERFGQII